MLLSDEEIRNISGISWYSTERMVISKLLKAQEADTLKEVREWLKGKPSTTVVPKSGSRLITINDAEMDALNRGEMP